MRTCCGLLPLPNQPPNQPPPSLLLLPSVLPAALLESNPGDCSSPSGEAPSGAAIGADGSGAGAAVMSTQCQTTPAPPQMVHTRHIAGDMLLSS